jgi:hypothetical protein
VRQVLLIVAEVAVLAVAQFGGGPPWTAVTALALVCESVAGLTAAGLARLAAALVWVGLFRLTDNRELFFPFCMYLAAHAGLGLARRSLAVRGQSPPRPLSTWPTGRKAEVFDGRRSPHPAAADFVHGLLGAGAAALVAAAFLGIRVMQEASWRVLAVETAVTAAVLGGVFLARGPATVMRSWWRDTALVIAASLAAFAGLAL